MRSESTMPMNLVARVLVATVVTSAAGSIAAQAAPMMLAPPPSPVTEQAPPAAPTPPAPPYAAPVEMESPVYPPFYAVPLPATFVARAPARPVPSGPHRIFGADLRVGIGGSRADLGPFLSGDGVVETTLAAAYGLARTARLHFAAGVEWVRGISSSSARGSQTSLEANELAAVLQARVSLASRLAAFARLTPGATRVEARLSDDAGIPTGAYTQPTLRQIHWVPSATASAGLAFRLAATSRNPGALEFGYWLTAEAGYRYTPSYAVQLQADAPATAGRSDRALALGDLSLQGGFFRFGAALTF